MPPHWIETAFPIKRFQAEILGQSKETEGNGKKRKKTEGNGRKRKEADAKE